MIHHPFEPGQICDVAQCIERYTYFVQRYTRGRTRFVRLNSRTIALLFPTSFRKNGYIRGFTSHCLSDIREVIDSHPISAFWIEYVNIDCDLDCDKASLKYWLLFVSPHFNTRDIVLFRLYFPFQWSKQYSDSHCSVHWCWYLGVLRYHYKCESELYLCCWLHLTCIEIEIA